MNEYLININGNITTGAQAKISVFDRGFLYGDSVYEATRTFSRKPFRIMRHLDRLFESARMVSIIPTLTKEHILAEIEKTIAASPDENIRLRIVLTRGSNSSLGLDPELSGPNNLIIFAKTIAPNPNWWLTKGLTVIFAAKTLNETGSLPKTGNYQENMLAYKSAKEAGVDDALMVNGEGFITEATTSNAWMVKDNVLYTPSLSAGILDGLTRKTLLEMAKSNKLPLKLVEANLTKKDFLGADECFFTSTTRNLVPVTTIDNQKVGTGKPGPHTLELLKQYLEYVQNNY
jgi:branched-chain amino acid aminotransferase